MLMLIFLIFYRPAVKWLAFADLAILLIVIGFVAFKDRTAIPELRIVNDSGQEIVRIAVTCASGAGCRDDDLLDGGRLPVGGSWLVPVPDAEKQGCIRDFTARLTDESAARLDGVDVCQGSLHLRFTAPEAGLPTPAGQIR